MGLSAILSALAIALPLLDAAIKDHNYQKVKYYQQQIDAIQTKFNVKQSEFNKLLNYYQNKYSRAVDSYLSSVRGSSQFRKAVEARELSQQKIETIQNDLDRVTKQSEQTANAIREEQRKYENKGLVERVSDMLGGN